MQNNNQSLLSILKRLYSQLSRISLNATQARTSLYKREVRPQLNITTVLNNQVEELSSRVIAGSISTENIVNAPNVPNSKGSQNKAINYQDIKIKDDSDGESEFAKHLQQRKPPSVTQPLLGERLKLSAWEHIHSAIRHAKNGDTDTAKLHVTIAGTALEEAGDYLSHEDYSELVHEIEVYFAKQLE